MGEKQNTFASEFAIQGTGLHTGQVTTLLLKPASAGNGIVFVKKIDGARIPARCENVTAVTRGTTIASGESSISTIEHLMAALFAAGIDNAEIEIDSDEPPILDGSSAEFYKLIKKAGVKEQEKDREYLGLKEAVTFENKDSRYIAIPSDEFRISCVIEYDHPLLGTQYKSLAVTEKSFVEELSSARTFCFDYEIELLREKGLAKGGTLDNAVVIGAKKFHSKLRYPDEFVRHKMLDMVGDLYLLGARLKAHIIAVKCGHAANAEFTKLLRQKTVISKKPLMEFGIEEIKKRIPHRHPFLFVDKVEITEEGIAATGYKGLTANEYFFRHNKTEKSPAVFNSAIVEGLAQTSCVLFFSRPELTKNKLAFFMGINYMKFHGSASAGDSLRYEVLVTRARARGGKIRGAAFSNGKLLCESEFMFSIVDK